MTPPGGPHRLVNRVRELRAQPKTEDTRWSFLDGAVLTPEERQVTVIVKALQARRGAWPHEGFYYRGGADLLLQHGTFFSGRLLLPEYQEFRGEAGYCFNNAFAAVEQDSSLTYWEGVYSIGRGHYTPHAWACDAEGRLLEFTMPTSQTDIENGVEYQTGLPVLDLKHWGYWGCRFHIDYVRAERESGSTYGGLLDRPTQDAGEGVPEWRDDWPVLRYPYDPERRTI